MLKQTVNSSLHPSHSGKLKLDRVNKVGYAAEHEVDEVPEAGNKLRHRSRITMCGTTTFVFPV